MNAAAPSRVARLAAAAALAVAVGCGDSRPPTTPGTGLTISPSTLTLKAVLSQRIRVTMPDGSPVTTPLQWTSTNDRVAYVFGDTLVRGIAEGTATLTAAANGLSGTLTVTVPADLSIGEFVRPLPSDAVAANVFDHDLPYEFIDAYANGYLLSYWNDRILPGVDSHNGYDWLVPIGTPVLAAGAGRVVSAGLGTASACPLLGGAIVAPLFVQIAHGAKPNELIETLYLHLSRVDVKVGDEVTAGQQVGLSGTTGCSTGPHLHFGAYRVRGNENRIRVMDPYGWSSSSQDPWVADTGGVASIAIWSPTKGPKLYGELRFSAGYGSARAGFYAAHFWGVDDADNPNNEWIAFNANSSVGTTDVSGWTIRNHAGDRFTIPAGTSANTVGGLTIYSGSGSTVPGVKYWGMRSGVWNDLGDCAQLFDASGALVSSVSWGNVTCPGAANAARAPSPPLEIPPASVLPIWPQP